MPTATEHTHRQPPASGRATQAQNPLDALIATMEDGPSVADLLGLEDAPTGIHGFQEEEAEHLYALAYEQYTAENLEDACKVFQFLCTLKPREGRFWMGYGGCLQGTGRYRDAMTAYRMAAMDHTFGMPLPFLHIATCFVLLQQMDRAGAVLQYLLHMGAPATPTDMACHEKARHMLRLLET